MNKLYAAKKNKKKQEKDKKKTNRSHSPKHIRKIQKYSIAAWTTTERKKKKRFPV